MKLTIESDTKSPLGTTVKIDGKKVGFLTAISFFANMDTDQYSILLKGFKRNVDSAPLRGDSFTFEIKGSMQSTSTLTKQSEFVVKELKNNLSKERK